MEIGDSPNSFHELEYVDSVELRKHAVTQTSVKTTPTNGVKNVYIIIYTEWP